MSQSHYHVFLPPTLSSLSPPIPRLSFQDLTVSREVESQLDFNHASQISRLQRIRQSQSQSQAQSQSDLSRHDQKGKTKEEPVGYEVDISTQYTWPPTPLEVIGSGNSKRRGNEGDRSRGVAIKRSRAPLTLSGNSDKTTSTAEDQDQDQSVAGEMGGPGLGSGSRRRSSRVRRSHSGMSLLLTPHSTLLLPTSHGPCLFNTFMLVQY
jgi:hypothetical protein